MKVKLNKTKWLINFVQVHFLSEMHETYAREVFASENPLQGPSKDWIVTFLQSKGCNVSTEEDSLYFDFSEGEVFWNELSYG